MRLVHHVVRFIATGSLLVSTSLAFLVKQSAAANNEITRFMGPAEAWMAYNTALQTDPLVTKSITASIILGAADLTGQALERSKRSVVDESTGIDWARSARFAFFGLVLQAPWNHFYFQWLDGWIPPTDDPFTITNGIKVAIDQAIQAPVFTILIFVFLGLLEGKQYESIQRQLQKEYKKTMLANCKSILMLTAFCARTNERIHTRDPCI